MAVQNQAVSDLAASSFSMACSLAISLEDITHTASCIRNGLPCSTIMVQAHLEARDGERQCAYSLCNRMALAATLVGRDKVDLNVPLAFNKSSFKGASNTRAILTHPPALPQ